MSDTPRLILFDDQRGAFGPLTRLRAAFGLRTGVLNNRVRIEMVLKRMATDLVVPPPLQARYAEHETDAQVNQPLRRDAKVGFHALDQDGSWHPVQRDADAPVLLVNGRWTGCGALDASAVTALQPGQAIIQPDGSLVAAHLPIDDAQRVIDAGFTWDGDAHRLDEDVLLSRPWHIHDQLDDTLAHDLPRYAQGGDTDVHPSAVLDETQGPVVIDTGATVGALAVLQGPCYIGRNSVVQPQALLRPNTVVGNTCKVAGEISFSVIDDYTNKAHAGYLGHALLGQWVNLGADTTASNLKNTYGPVRVQLSADTEPENTGRTFQGPILGDYTRTAIGTRINTGAVLDTGVMYAASTFTPKYIAPATFFTDAGPSRCEPDKLIATAKAMMARRKQAMPAALEDLLRALCA